MKTDKYLLKRRSGSIAIFLMRTIFLLGIGFYILYPLFLKVMASFMSQADIFDATVSVVPKNFTWENFVTVFETMNYPTAFLNTVLLSSMVMLFQINSSMLVGYGFGKFDFPCKNLIFRQGY